MRYRLLRRLGLFVAILVPGIALLLVLASKDPLPRQEGARVGTVASSGEDALSLDTAGSPVTVLPGSKGLAINVEIDVEVEDDAGNVVLRRFKPWVLRCRALDAMTARDPILELAKEPATLEELAGPRRLAARVSAKRARGILARGQWTDARLSGSVVCQGWNPEAQEARLETEELVCDLEQRWIASDREVTFTHGSFRVVGTGLRAGATLRRVEILRDVVLTADLEEGDLPWAPRLESDGEAGPVTIRCGGPLLVEELEAGPGERRRIRVAASGEVVAARGDEAGLECRSLVLVLAVRPSSDPGSEEEVVEPISADIEAVHPLTLLSSAGDRVSVEGAILRWRRRSDDAWEATVEGAPRVVVEPPGDAPEIETTCQGPAHLLVEGAGGFAQAIFRDRVVIRRADETLRADEATVERREASRALIARGHVEIAGEALRAWAERAQGSESDDGTRQTVLRGTPRLIVRGRGGLGVFNETSRGGADENGPEAETEVKSGGPMVLVERKSGVDAAADGGVTIVRRLDGREVGRASAESIRLRRGVGEAPEIEQFDARGGVEVDSDLGEKGRLSVRAGQLRYRREDRTLVLEDNRPLLHLVDARGRTTLQGDRIVWNRLTGDFEVTGPVEAEVPGGIDLLAALRREKPAGEAAGPAAAPHRLRCSRLTGRIAVGEGGKGLEILSAVAIGAVQIDGPDGLARGERLEMRRADGGYAARLEGKPARVERPLGESRVDVVTGPVLEVAGGIEGELQGLRAPQGGSAVVHVEPRDEKGDLTRIDVRSEGAVVLADGRIEAPGGVEFEHRTWDAKTSAWGPVLRVGGEHLSGRFAQTEKGRVVESLEIRGDVDVRPPDGSRLQCARATVDPQAETIELTGDPDLTYTDVRGRIRRARSAFYRYRADVEGTRIRVRGFR